MKVKNCDKVLNNFKFYHHPLKFQELKIMIMLKRNKER